MFASLANVLGQLENTPSPVPAALRDHQLHQVEIKYGLLQVRRRPGVSAHGCQHQAVAAAGLLSPSRTIYGLGIQAVVLTANHCSHELIE